jgi:hypothetical protein
MELKVNLTFELQGPKVDTVWSVVKYLSIPQISDFPTCNDENFNSIGIPQ